MTSTPDAGEALSCRGLHVARDAVPVLHGIDLVVPTGTWISLVGPNGSGKTTLLYAMAGLIASRNDFDIATGNDADADRQQRDLGPLPRAFQQDPRQLGTGK